jgi:hypothetical protein
MKAKAMSLVYCKKKKIIIPLSILFCRLKQKWLYSDWLAQTCGVDELVVFLEVN